MALGLGGRIGIGLGFGLCLILGLNFLLQEEPAEAAGSDIPSALETGTPLPSGIPRGRAMLLYLVAPGEIFPGTVAPLAEIQRGGAVKLIRGAPPAMHPQDGELWLAAGVILPAAELSRLDPLERAALLNLLSIWSVPEGLRPEQVEALGLRFRPGELRGLLRWLR